MVVRKWYLRKSNDFIQHAAKKVCLHSLINSIACFLFVALRDFVVSTLSAMSTVWGHLRPWLTALGLIGWLKMCLPCIQCAELSSGKETVMSLCLMSISTPSSSAWFSTHPPLQSVPSLIDLRASANWRGSTLPTKLAPVVTLDRRPRLPVRLEVGNNALMRRG